MTSEVTLLEQAAQIAELTRVVESLRAAIDGSAELDLSKVPSYVTALVQRSDRMEMRALLLEERVAALEVTTAGQA